MIHDAQMILTQSSSDEFSKLNAPITKNYYAPKEKNRYSSIIPNETTRIHLSHKEGQEHSDYINANAISVDINGRSQEKYIACQAPLESTIVDFWRMIWEKNCGVIVMVTRLYEGNVQKSACYWPEEGQVCSYGNFLVCHKRCFQIGDITIRSLLVRLENGSVQNTTREVIQLHYGGWPDFDAPTSTKPVRDLLVLMNKFQERANELYGLKGPLIVHCSAGVGRTGALIACHVVLEKLKNKEFPDIKSTVESLRMQRHHMMVKNEKQYEFIFKVAKDIVRDMQIASKEAQR